MKSALILTYYRFPMGDAGSIRQESFCRLFESCGYSVTVTGMGDSTGFVTKKYNGISYISFIYGNSRTDKIRNIALYKKNLKKFLYDSKPFDVISVVDIPFPALFYIKRYAQKRNITLIHDSVEWYSPEQFEKGRYSVPYILKNLYNTKWIDNSFRVIAISSFLKKHFESRNIKTAQVPVILDVNSIDSTKDTSPDKLVLMYAGSPGKKDYIKEIIDGCALLDDSMISRLELRLIGMKKEHLTTLCGASPAAIEKLGTNLIIMDRMPNKQVKENLKEADFTVLLRSPDLRYAKAGFPTKVVESLAGATPVICNITSDLGEYIIDTENGLIAESCSAEAFADAVRRAMLLTDEEKKRMQKNSRKCAEENFDYHIYTDLFNNFIN